MVQPLYFLNTKCQASSHLVWLYSLVCVGPGRKPRRPVFSQRGSYMNKAGFLMTQLLIMFFVLSRNLIMTSYLIGFETSVVTMTTSCRDVLTRRNEHPNTKHPSEYVSFVANVTNASRFSAKKNQMSLVMRRPSSAKTKTHISCAVIALLISTFVFTIGIVQSLY